MHKISFIDGKLIYELIDSVNWQLFIDKKGIPFDILKLYKNPVQQDIFGNLVCPKIIIQNKMYIEDVNSNYPEYLQRQNIICKKCHGNGFNYNLEECSYCNGEGIIDVTGKKEDYIINKISDLELEINNKKYMVSYNIAQILFSLNGNKFYCLDNFIIIS